MHSHAPDLLDSADVPSIFESWIAVAGGKSGSQPMREESVAVYRDIWTALTKWCAAKRIDFLAITAMELDAYLRSRPDDLTERYAWRVLRLVERILQHHARSVGEEPNMAVAELLRARPEINYSNAAANDELPELLDSTDARTLVTYLTTVPAPSDRETWQDLRNKCAVALHLGAGLTPAELRALTVGAIHRRERGTRKIRAPTNGTVLEHDAPIAD